MKQLGLSVKKNRAHCQSKTNDDTIGYGRAKVQLGVCVRARASAINHVRFMSSRKHSRRIEATPVLDLDQMKTKLGPNRPMYDPYFVPTVYHRTTPISRKSRSNLTACKAFVSTERSSGGVQLTYRDSRRVKGHVIEFFDHLTFAELAQVSPAPLSRRTRRVFCCQRLERRPILSILERR